MHKGYSILRVFTLLTVCPMKEEGMVDCKRATVLCSSFHQELESVSPHPLSLAWPCDLFNPENRAEVRV